MRKMIMFVLLLMAIHGHTQTYQPTWESLDKRPVPQWYKDVKFGIFIHWGVYAVPAFCGKGNYAEWYQHALNSGDSATVKYQREKFGSRTYYQLADDFKAELFNPDEWASVFERSGAKYIVLTSKHHDGFANWPSKEANKTWGFPWNAAVEGPHRDLLGDLFAAVRKTSVHAGMYYSLYEWYNPLWLKDKKRYVEEHAWPQMKDLITTYKPDVFWTDGDWEASDDIWKSKEMLAWMYNESPVKDRVVTYDRWGGGVRFHHGGVYTPEYQPDVDFEDHYWEESRGMGFSYGYNREEDAWDYNSAQSLVLQLVDKVSRGGNFLLDIGPDEHGKIPPIMQERLLQIGDWLKINGEAIYHTQRWRTASQWSDGKKDFKPHGGGGDILLKLTVDPDPGYAVKECFFTYNAEHNDVYAIMPKWPKQGKIILHSLPLAPGTKISMLETHEELQWAQQGNDVAVSLPVFDPDVFKSAYAYVLKIGNTGSFAPKPKIAVSYPKDAFRPMANISSADSVAIYYTLDGSDPTEHSQPYTKPFSVNQTSALAVRGFKKGSLPSALSTASLMVYEWKKVVSPGAVKPGVVLSRYKLQSPVSTDAIDQAVATRTDVVTAISIHDTLQRENAGMKYSGFLKIPEDGLYIFHLSSDDGSKLWIDDSLIIDDDGLHGSDEQIQKAALKKGLHTFQLSYFQGSGDAALELAYSLGAEKKKPIPSSWFYHHVNF